MIIPRLRDLVRLFGGQIPASIATCSPTGIPNIASLSIVHLIDDEHVALSYQFFNKTRANLMANPVAQLLVLDVATFVQYRLDVRYLRTETEGLTYECLRSNLAAVASVTGMTEVFRLQGIDVYRVVGVEILAHDLDLASHEPPPDFVGALEVLSTRLAACTDLDALLTTTLQGLAELLDYPHSILLFADGAGTHLYTIASHGFSSSSVGGEVRFGEGAIGTAARDRRPVRIASFAAERIMADAVSATAIAAGRTIERREVAIPGLPDIRALLAVPILARDRVLGVLCVQSATAGRFGLADEQVTSTLARHLATSIQLLGSASAPEEPARSAAPRPAGGVPLTIRYHASDDSISIDHEYLIRGLPGRILFRLLSTFTREGRVDFSNKELRLDATLGLAAYRDNLEARLILLRRRLDERCPGLRLVPTGRGRFRLVPQRAFELISER